MADVGKNGFKKLSDYVETSNFKKVVEYGAFTYICLRDKSRVKQTLHDLQAWPGVKAYAMEELPDYFHLKKSNLDYDIFVKFEGDNLLKPGNSPIFIPSNSWNDIGMHGWDDTVEKQYDEGKYPDMRGIFMANGPKFKSGHSHEWIKLVDEYQIFLQVLDLEGKPHNGTWERVEQMFSSSKGFSLELTTLLVVFNFYLIYCYQYQ